MSTRWLAWAALLLGTGAALSAHAAPPPLPWIAPVEGRVVDCDNVTLEDCTDPDFFYDTACGEEQRTRLDSTCSLMLYGEIETLREAQGDRLSMVPENMSDSGLDYVVQGVRTGEERTYTPDMFSVHSQRAASGHVTPNGEVAGNLYDMWAANGTEITSCREYVWEKYAEINEFHRAANRYWTDGREVFRIAYGPGSELSSIGRRHMSDPTLRGLDGRPFGQLFHQNVVLRHALYGLRDFPGGDAWGPEVDQMVPLLESLRARSLAASVVLDKFVGAPASERTVVRSWQWNWMASNALSYDHHRRDADEDDEQDGQITLDQLQGVPPQNGGVQHANLGFASQEASGRRYLDEELDDIDAMLQRAMELQDMWAAANTRYLGSGWTVDDAGLAAPPLIAIPNPGPQRAPGPQGATNPSLGFAWGPPQPPPLEGPSQIATEDQETVVRRFILDELTEILVRANSLGCFDEGWSPCDWSPRRFARRINNDFGAFQDQSYAFCNEWTNGNLANVLNLNVPFVDDDDYPIYKCSVQTGPTITAEGFEAMVDQVELCRGLQVEYQIQKELDEAQARVREIPELVNPATGDFQRPGETRGSFRRMGNENFGMSYDYGYGFDSTINAEICQLDLYAGGHIDARVFVWGVDVTLIDGAAEVDTEARTVDVFLRVINKNIFVPRKVIDPEVHIEVGEVDDLNFYIGEEFETSRRQKVVDVRIVVVVVPLSIQAGVGGRVGLGLGLSVDAVAADNNGCPSIDVGARVAPFLGIDGFVEAAVDIWIAGAGIRGTLEIVSAELVFEPTIGVAVLAATTDPEDYELRIGVNLDLILSTLSGKLEAFARAGPCPFCATVDWTIVAWEGPSWEMPLIDQTYTLSLADLFAAFP